MKKNILIIVVFLLTFSGTILAWEAPYDFEGRTVTFDWRDSSEYEDFFEEGADREYLEEVEEKFNVNIEFTNTWPEDQIIANVLGGDSADVFLLEPPHYEAMALEGVFHNLNDYLDDDFWDRVPKAHRENKDFYSIAGDFYSFPSAGAPDPETDLLVNPLFWNKTLFEKEQLPNLYELQANNEWTWDALKDIAAEVVDDTDGDGEIDQWALASAWPFDRNVLFMALSSNNASLTKEVDGKIEFSATDPEAIAAFDLLVDLIHDYEAVAVPTDGSSPGTLPKGHTEHFMDGDVAMFVGGQWHGGNFIDNMEDDVGIVNFPLGPNGDDYTSYAYSLMPGISTVTEEDPEALIELTGALHRSMEPYISLDDYDERMLEGYYSLSPDRESSEVYQEVIDGNWNYEDYNLLIELEFRGPATWPILKGTEPVEATINEVEPQIQSMLDEVINDAIIK